MTISTPFINTFQETLEKAQTWFVDLAQEMNWDEAQAYHGLRAVLHALRDRLTVAECAHLASHMPMLIRGIFYEGWRPSTLPIKLKTREEFYTYILSRFNADTDLDVERLVHAVFTILPKKVSGGDLRKIIHSLPEDLQNLWPA